MTKPALTKSLFAAAAICVALSAGANPTLAAGELTNSWRTADGWLTEQRMHPGGAKVCSTGKAGSVPHTFGLSIIRSGQENLLMVVDQQQPPTAAGDMTFVQNGQTVGTLATQVAGPGFASANPNGRQTPDLLAKLGPGALTINVAGRQYQADMSGLPAAMAQLSSCAAGS
jgi:hypothetical protein